MANPFVRLWRRLFPTDTAAGIERERRRLARAIEAYHRVDESLLDEGSLAHVQAQRARDLDPGNPLTTAYNLYSTHNYVRTLAPLPEDRTENLAREYCTLIILHVVRTQRDPDTDRYPVWAAVEGLMWQDPATILQTLRDSPVGEVRQMARHLQRQFDHEALFLGIASMRRRFARS